MTQELQTGFADVVRMVKKLETCGETLISHLLSRVVCRRDFQTRDQLGDMGNSKFREIDTFGETDICFSLIWICFR